PKNEFSGSIAFLTDQNCEAAQNNRTAMGSRIPQPGGKLSAYLYGGGSIGDGVRRTCTGGHVSHTGCGHSPDKDGGTSWWQNRPPDMRYRTGYHRTQMQIRNSGCR